MKDRDIVNLFKRIFTMLELLIVISVIMVLMSLLLPALRGSMEMGKRISCGNQMRQIGLAFHSYADDNNDSLCWYTDWSKVLEPYTKQIYESKLYTGSYKGKKMPFYFCSSNNYWMTYIGGYMVNARIVGGAAYGPARRFQITQATKIILMSEPGNNGGYFYSSFSDSTHLVELTCRIAWCHNKQTDVLFVDGHILPYKKDSITYDMINAGITLPGL